MNRPIGYWAKRLDASLQAQLDSTLALGVRLTRRQWQVLNTLSSAPATPAEMRDILRPFNTGDGGQERALAALVRRELVFLLDGRLALTGDGYALHSEVSRLLEATRHELTAGIGTDEYAIAVSVLERMSNNADRIAAG